MLIVLPQGLLSNINDARVRDYIHSEAEIRAIISLPPHTFTPSGVPMVNTCIVYLQKFTEEKRRLYKEKIAGLSEEEVRTLVRADPEFDYPVFMGIAENIGYEPSGRATVKPGDDTDLDLLIKDYFDQGALPATNVNVFEFANERYGELRVDEQETVVGVPSKSLKTSFVVPFSETAERLDPPFYLLHRQAKKLIEPLRPLGNTIHEQEKKFRPASDAELDAEYKILSVSNDGLVTLNKLAHGEDFRAMRKVQTGDIVYNPMRVNIGSIGVVPKQLRGGLVSPDYVVFRSTWLDPDFLVTLLRSPFYRMYIDVMTTGSIRDRLYFEVLQSIRVPEVSTAEQAAICATAHRADAAHEALRQAAEDRTGIVNRLNALVQGPAAEAADDPIEAFRALADRWRRETGMYSSISKKIQHPAYQKIIAMGDAAVPLILQELRTRPAHWFSALKTITNASPAGEKDASNVKQTTAAWLSWGKKLGLID